MEKIEGIDPNNDLEREKKFKETALNFLQTLKVKTIEKDYIGEKILSKKDLELCDKIKIEKEEDKKNKNAERKIKELCKKKGKSVNNKDEQFKDFEPLKRKKAPFKKSVVKNQTVKRKPVKRKRMNRKAVVNKKNKR